MKAIDTRDLHAWVAEATQGEPPIAVAVSAVVDSLGTAFDVTLRLRKDGKTFEAGKRYAAEVLLAAHDGRALVVAAARRTAAALRVGTAVDP